jgi:hypothetical protein
MTTEAETSARIQKSADMAQERLLQSAKKAQQRLQDACEVAVGELEKAAQAASDRRDLNGSYRWGRQSDSSDRLRNVEKNKEKLDLRMGSLEVGQAKREEQIIGLINTCDDSEKSIGQIRSDFEKMNKEIDLRLTTMRELMLGIKEACNLKVDTLRDDTQQDKIKNQQYVIGIVVGFIVTVVAAILLAYTHIRS